MRVLRLFGFAMLPGGLLGGVLCGYGGAMFGHPEPFVGLAWLSMGLLVAAGIAAMAREAT